MTLITNETYYHTLSCENGTSVKQYQILLQIKIKGKYFFLTDIFFISVIQADEKKANI